MMSLVNYRLTSVFIFALIFINSAFAQNRKDEESNWNYVYVNYFHELFDQSKVLESPEYKSALTDGEREDVLERHFLKTKMNAVITSAKWAFTAGAGIAAFGTVYMFKLRHMFDLPAINPLIVASGGLSATVMSLAFFYQPISTVMQWMSGQAKGAALAIYQYFSGTTTDSLEKYEVRYIRKKPKLSPQFQNTIEDAIFASRTTDPNERFGSNEENAKIAPQLIDHVLALPSKIKETTYDRDRIDEIFHCYSDETKKELRRLVVRHVAGNDGQLMTQKHAVFFKGPPGTGKTRAARLVAKALEVPFQEISLADVNKDQFVGSRQREKGGPGLLANAMIRASQESEGIKNFVLLIDEADRVLNSEKSEQLQGLPNYMLMFLDPSRTSYFNEFFKADVNTSDMTIILAGNFEIKDDALKNRLHMVNFDKIELQCKREIVWKQYFPEIFAKYKNSKFALKEEDFSEADRQQFDDVITKDEDPGMRTIYKALEHYIEDLIIDKIEQKYADHR